MRYRPTGRPRRSRPLRRRDRPPEVLVSRTSVSSPSSGSPRSGRSPADALVTDTGTPAGADTGVGFRVVSGATGTGATGATGGRAGRVSPIRGRSTPRVRFPTLGGADAAEGDPLPSSIASSASGSVAVPAVSSAVSSAVASAASSARSPSSALSPGSGASAPAAPDGRDPAGRRRRRRGPDDDGREPPDVTSSDGVLSAVARSGTPRGAEWTPSRAVAAPGSVDAGAAVEPVGSAVGCPALVSDMGRVPSRTAHDARSQTTAAPAASALRGSQREPSRSIH